MKNKRPGKSRATFFVFEDNPYWFTVLTEKILQEAETKSVEVLVYTNVIPMKLTRDLGWIRSQGGSFRNFNKAKYWVRKCLNFLIPSTKPIEIFKKNLKNVPNVHISLIEHSELVNLKAIISENEQNLVREIVNMSLQEDLGTQYLQKYMDSTILANYVESGLTMMCHLMEKISSLSNTDIYYMNGRTLYERITYECCRSLNVQSYALEINSLEDRIQEFEGTAINTESYRSQAEKLWEQFLIAYGEQVTRSMAEKYFENRRLNHKQNQFLRFLRDADTSITKSSKIKIAFFSSSNEELASIYSIYRQSKPNQDHIIKELILRFTSKSFVDQCMFIIRVHPNVRRKKSEDKLFYDNLVNSENIIIHNYQSNVDSYNLISNADIVVTVGSTIGLEASFLGKMSFSFAKTLWGDLGAVKLVSSIQDIFNYATNYDLEKAKLGALKYGLFMQYYGKEFEYCSLKQKRLLATKNSFDVLENVSKLLTWQKR